MTNYFNDQSTPDAGMKYTKQLPSLEQIWTHFFSDILRDCAGNYLGEKRTIYIMRMALPIADNIFTYKNNKESEVGTISSEEISQNSSA